MIRRIMGRFYHSWCANIILFLVVCTLLIGVLWYIPGPAPDWRLDEKPMVEYHNINITVHEVNREAYAYLDDNDTLVWENRYHLAFDYTIELTYDAPFKGDIDCMLFYLKADNETISHDSWGWSGVLSPGKGQTITGTYSPDIWIEDGTNLTLGFDLWHKYINSSYVGHRSIGRVDVDVDEPWEVVKA